MHLSTARSDANPYFVLFFFIFICDFVLFQWSDEESIGARKRAAQAAATAAANAPPDASGADSGPKKLAPPISKPPAVTKPPPVRGAPLPRGPPIGEAATAAPVPTPVAPSVSAVPAAPVVSATIAAPIVPPAPTPAAAVPTAEPSGTAFRVLRKSILMEAPTPANNIDSFSSLMQAAKVKAEKEKAKEKEMESQKEKEKEREREKEKDEAKKIESLIKDLPSSQQNKAVEMSTAAVVRANQRIRDLEAEVFELQKKLDRALSRLTQQPGGADALSRETELENELALAADKYAKLRHANRSLELTVKELQSRLAQAETDKFMTRSGDGKSSSGNANQADDADTAPVRRTRERELEEALIKAKTEKDRAVKVLISVLGKAQVAEFLSKNAGAPDILDSLCNHFQSMFSGRENVETSNRLSTSGKAGANSGAEVTSDSKKSRKRIANNVKKSLAPTLGAGRSRSDEMYSSSSRWG